MSQTENQETKLEETRVRESLILDALPICFFSASADGDYGGLWVSEQVEHLSGFTPESFLKESGFWLSRVHPQDRDQTLAAYSTIKEKGRTSVEYRWQVADGSYHWFHDSSVLVRGEDNQSHKVVGVWLDVTEMRQARDQRDRFFTLALDLVCVASLDGYFKEINPAFESTLGYTSQELLSRPFIDFVHPDDKEQTLQTLQNLIEGMDVISFENRYLDKSGSIHWLQWSSSVDLDAGLAYATARDITEQRRMQQVRASAEVEWIQAMDQVDEPIYLLDMDRHLKRANKAFYSISSSSPDEAIDRHIVDIIHPDGEEDLCPVCIMQEQRENDVVTLEADHPSNPAGIPIEVTMRIIRGVNKEPTGMLLNIHDLSNSRKLEEEQLLAASVFDNTQSAILITDTRGMIEKVNLSFSQITGFEPHEVIGKTPRVIRSDHHDKAFYDNLWDTIRRNGNWEGEIWNRRKSGEVFPVWQSITAVRGQDGQVTRYIGSFTDITEQKLSDERIHHLAHYDVLTELPNRWQLNEHANRMIENCRRTESQFSLFFIDLDHFKRINDSLGHPIGDEVLQRVAERLRATVREEDVVGRLGGDEFVIILQRIESPHEAEKIARKLQIAFLTPLHISGHELMVTLSIGICIYPADGTDTETLIKHADIAMYHAKEKGRNSIDFYQQHYTEEVVERMRLETLLRKALDNDEFILYYQPQYSLTKGYIVGAEALLRWNSPEYGKIVPPDHFIHIAEELGDILAIGEWVLNQACIQAKRWQEEHPRFERIAVNLAGLQIQRGNIVDQVDNALSQSGLDPEYLELEISENFIMQENLKDIDVLKSLQNLGANLSIDDFGTGHSSLKYLKRLPVTILKIDRSFIMDIPGDPNDVAITQAIIAMAKNLSLDVIAEGVETQEQAELLQNYGCDIVQGFYFGKPIPAAEFEQLI